MAVVMRAFERFPCEIRQERVKQRTGNCTDPMRLDTFCVVVSSYQVDLTAPASISFQTQLELDSPRKNEQC